ncbi:hypothetical protein [Nesterenkonia rhizosphaerae]|uniref:Uncharacterized protein n=1 Tax=Nesterenkonia rhizosphaerae TaxID=1348272 RepID=A0ABP9G0F6_9MICC
MNTNLKDPAYSELINFYVTKFTPLVRAREMSLAEAYAKSSPPTVDHAQSHVISQAVVLAIQHQTQVLEDDLPAAINRLHYLSPNAEVAGGEISSWIRRTERDEEMQRRIKVFEQERAEALAERLAMYREDNGRHRPRKRGFMRLFRGR